MKPTGKKRRSVPPDDQTAVLERCRRRCCLCFALANDVSQKEGQLAHLDHDRSNNNVDNLVFLCLEHHAKYDAKMIQAKNMSEAEVRKYREMLELAVQEGRVPPEAQALASKQPNGQQIGSVNINGGSAIIAGGDVHYTVQAPKPTRRRKGSSSSRPPIIPGTVAENPRMIGYLNYLVRRYEKFKKWECERAGRRMGYGVIRNRYKDQMHYELIHTPVAQFEKAARYLQERIRNTKLGRMRKGQKLYDSFDEFDDNSEKVGLPD